MFGIRSDLPLRKDAAGQFVQWLVMVLVFMAAIAATVGSYSDALLTHWNRSVTGTLTVQIPSSADTSGKNADRATRDLAAALAAVKALPSVASATPIPRDKVLELLQPWLGAGEAVNDLPLPALIDIQLSDTSGDASAAVTAAVTKAVPAATVDDHRIWLNRVTNLAEAVGWIALSLIVLIGGALALTVIFATRASLAEFGQVIEVLHLVGARDDYIAGQFATRALGQGILGGVLGLIIYAPALALIAWLGSRVEQGILPDVNVSWSLWFVLAILPFIAGMLAMVTAHVTVRRALQAMV